MEDKKLGDFRLLSCSYQTSDMLHSYNEEIIVSPGKTIVSDLWSGPGDKVGEGMGQWCAPSNSHD